MKNINEAMKNLKLKRLDEMAARVGITKDNYLIYVNSDDKGFIPHFHYVDAASRGTDKKKGFHTCIKIEKSEYFLHEGKMNTLNQSQREELNKFLSQPFKRAKFSGGTNWDYVVSLWNDNNSSKNVDEDLEMPDYTNIKLTEEDKRRLKKR